MSKNSSFKSIPIRDVVTFSAEHPQHKVKNLLKTGSGKWTSPKGHDEVYIDVELSLPSCYIKSLDIGNMWSHSVDIEVGRADEASTKREPLLKSPAILMNRQQAQSGQNKEVMRFFTVDDFNPFSVGRWVDRIRIVCRQPFRRDVAFGLSTLVVRGSGLDDDDDSDELDANAAAAKQRKSSYGVDMTHIDGVKKLKSKLSKQLNSSSWSSASPKSKYSKLFESSTSPNSASSSSAKKKPATSAGGQLSVEDEFRETVLEFIQDVDADNKLEYKELLRRWVQIRGRPRNDTEKTILKELTKSHAFGISSKKTDISSTATTSNSSSSNNKRKSSENDSSFNKKKAKTTVQNSDEEGESDGDSKPKAKKRGRPSKASKDVSSANSIKDGQTILASPSPPTIQYEPASINYILQEDPQKYVSYEDSELRASGILVHQKIYKKDKKLPLDGGDELFVEKGVLVTFYKNASNIHMRVKERVYVPEVEPEYVAGIFKNFTEAEITASDALVISEPKPILVPTPPKPSAILATPSPPAKNNSSGTTPGSGGGVDGKTSGSRKRKSSSPTKRVPITKRSPSPELSSEDRSSGEGSEPEYKPAHKKTPNSTGGGGSKGKGSTPSSSKGAVANSTSATNGSASKKTPSSSSGGECPLCQRTFNRIKELMAHCSTCNGLPEKSSTSSLSASPSKRASSASTPSKPPPSKSNVKTPPAKKAGEAAMKRAKAAAASKAPSKAPSKSAASVSASSSSSDSSDDDSEPDYKPANKKSTPVKASNAKSPAKSPGRPPKATSSGGGGSKTSTPAGKKKVSTSSSSTAADSNVEMAECPICGKMVPKKGLERHARMCAENAFG